ncbi:hypothetical protein [Methylobacterium sp. Leaf108]|uniref:hypothetical protein n=1 Tax=Methylobacterium sp. Leaf108 TaxID=1736256 RepID=UPI0006F33453|nr:hypothetical protein [Methylobacterium sp. Leaf108]KQP50226.1 hypothetical protein ASF39_12945 [Methylobacterium sp. Leaf108]
MLLDWLGSLITPAARDVRRLGYVRDSIWLLSRSRRCRAAWRPHLDLSRAFVVESIGGLPRRHTAVVLGSGLLDDVPLEALAEAFRSVVLVDLVHPWPARRRARRYRHVRLVDADLSGSIDWLLGRRSDLAPALPDLCRSPDVDLVISANVLSQLAILPLDTFEARGRVPPDLGARIVRAHLDGLAGLAARVCLLTDVEQVAEDRGGQAVACEDLLFGITMPEPDRRWDWTLAPFGEASRKTRLVHRVRAYRDWTG